MPQTLDKTQPTSPADTLAYAINLAKAGRKIEARNVLRRVVALQPVNQAAWLWLSALAIEQAEAEAALAQAQKINPAHPSLRSAQQWLVTRFSPQPSTKASETVASSASTAPQSAGNLWPVFNKLALGLAGLAVLIGLMVLFLGLGLELTAMAKSGRDIQNQTLAGPEAEQQLEHASAELATAWAARDWTKAIAILEALHQAEPETETIIAQLSHAYIQKGIALRHKGFIEEALTLFEQALVVTPYQLRAQREFELASNYLIGIQHYQAGQWPEALTALEAVWAEDKDYVNVRDLLYSAYYNHGLSQQAAGELSQARDAFETALRLHPDLPEPRLKIAELEFELAPQTPPSIPIPTGPVEDKLIVVGIAEQRMQVYQGDLKIFDFIVSTGEPGRDTAIGDFEVLDKIDVAYASTWNLDMPYWLGIYWSGPLENGIHGLPTVKHTGYKLWDGYLGQRVSYGCVILGDADIIKLYEWAGVGTRVKIVPSLADWTPER